MSYTYKNKPVTNVSFWIDSDGVENVSFTKSDGKVGTLTAEDFYNNKDEKVFEPKTPKEVSFYKSDEFVAKLIVNSKEYKQFIAENKLDEEAVGRLISGEQKSHKGFSIQ